MNKKDYLARLKETNLSSVEHFYLDLSGLLSYVMDGKMTKEEIFEKANFPKMMTEKELKEFLERFAAKNKNPLIADLLMSNYAIGMDPSYAYDKFMKLIRSKRAGDTLWKNVPSMLELQRMIINLPEFEDIPLSYGGGIYTPYQKLALAVKGRPKYNDSFITIQEWLKSNGLPAKEKELKGYIVLGGHLTALECLIIRTHFGLNNAHRVPSFGAMENYFKDNPALFEEIGIDDIGFLSAIRINRLYRKAIEKLRMEFPFCEHTKLELS